MNIEKTELFTIEFDDLEKMEIIEKLSSPIYPENNFQEYVEHIKSIKDNALNHVFEKVSHYYDLSRTKTGAPAVFCFKNLPYDQSINSAPKEGGAKRRIQRNNYLSENLLTALSLCFGNPYSIYCEGRGLINNLIPSTIKDAVATGVGSAADLDFHIENTAANFRKYSNCTPKAILFSGISSDPSKPATKIADIRIAVNRLSNKEKTLLSQPNFSFKFPYRWRDFNPRFEKIISKYGPVLCGNRKEPFFNLAVYGDMVAETACAESKKALMHLRELLHDVAIDITIEPGIIICVDNRVAAHARVPFKASMDEYGNPKRWLQRIFITDDLSNFDELARVDEHVYVPLLENAEDNCITLDH